MTADTSVFCGQTEPVPHYVYDTSSGQWGVSGDAQMSLTTYRLVNGSNNAKLNVYGAQSSKIDATKPMICYAQVYVVQTQGSKITTDVPVTQKFTLQAK